MADDSSLQSWAQKLDKLLQQAAAVKEAEDMDRIVAVQRALRRFKDESPDYADALDSQATLAIFDLDLAATQDAVAAIRDRAEEVYRLLKMIQGVGEETAKKASVLSGKYATEALDAATSAIISFKRLRDQLTSGGGNEKQIAAEIEKTIAAVATLRGKLEAA